MDIGEKLKQLRVKNGLTQKDLADRCDLTKGFISQVENNLASPSIATLMDVLESLGISAKDFFTDSTGENVVFGEEDVFSQEDPELGNTIRWLIPSAQKYKMEPILLTLVKGGRSQLYDPFEGEVFGYVIRGCVILHMGGRKHRVKKGESFYHSADAGHYLENGSSSGAEVLWATAPPHF